MRASEGDGVEASWRSGSASSSTVAVRYTRWLGECSSGLLLGSRCSDSPELVGSVRRALGAGREGERDGVREDSRAGRRAKTRQLAGAGAPGLERRAGAPAAAVLLSVVGAGDGKTVDCQNRSGGAGCGLEAEDGQAATPSNTAASCTALLYWRCQSSCPGLQRSPGGEVRDQARYSSELARFITGCWRGAHGATGRRAFVSTHERDHSE